MSYYVTRIIGLIVVVAVVGVFALAAVKTVVDYIDSQAEEMHDNSGPGR